MVWRSTRPSTPRRISGRQKNHPQKKGYSLQQTRLLTRAPVGTTVSVSITNGSERSARFVYLTAYDNGYDSLAKSSFFLGKQINDIGAANPMTDIVPQISNETVTTRTLPGGYTYLEILEESYSAYQPFKDAMLAAIQNKSPGMVIDLRFNGGGETSSLPALAAGSWTSRSSTSRPPCTIPPAVYTFH